MHASSRLLVGGRSLVALNAKTGKRYPDFGENGVVDLRKGQERGVETFSWRTGPSVVVRDVIVIGQNITDINNSGFVSKFTNPPATSAASMCGPANSFGSFTRFRGPVKSATKAGWPTRGPTPAA